MSSLCKMLLYKADMETCLINLFMLQLAQGEACARIFRTMCSKFNKEY